MALCTWGANSYGQLGLGHCDDQWNPVVVNQVPFKISHFGAGGGHSVIISDNGRIAFCGNNSKGQIGVEPSIKKVHSFTEIDHSIFASPPSKVSCGWEHTLITTVSGQVYGLGCNGYSQLGLDDQVAATSKPILIQDLQGIAKTACGLRHSMCLSRDGKVFTWGEGRKGQLARKIREDKHPTSVDHIPEPIVDICAGQHHSAALTVSGSVYTWGCNKYGQLGVNPRKSISTEIPTKVAGLPQNIMAIHSGWSHMIVCTSDGQLFGWGRSNYGQLGSQYKSGFSHEPTSITDFRCAIKDRSLLAVGSEHNLAMDDSDGTLKSWGWNEHGMCGLGAGSEDIIYKPQSIDLPISDKKIQKLSSGSGHCLAVFSD